MGEAVETAASRELKLSFRVGEPYAELLIEAAERLELSEHQLARLFLVQYLEQAELCSIKDGLAALGREMAALRRELAVALEAA
jgi:hypothetical protein